MPFKHPDRYRHNFQFSGDGSEQKTGQEKAEIERTEAVRHTREGGYPNFCKMDSRLHGNDDKIS